jgi:hypothetical protein
MMKEFLMIIENFFQREIMEYIMKVNQDQEVV